MEKGEKYRGEEETGERPTASDGKLPNWGTEREGGIGGRGESREQKGRRKVRLRSDNDALPMRPNLAKSPIRPEDYRAKYQGYKANPISN